MHQILAAMKLRNIRQTHLNDSLGCYAEMLIHTGEKTKTKQIIAKKRNRKLR